MLTIGHIETYYFDFDKIDLWSKQYMIIIDNCATFNCAN